MHVRGALADKVDEGKSKVLEFGVYIMEALGSVGLPAEQVAAAILALRPAPSSAAIADKKPKSKRKRRKNKKEDKTTETEIRNFESEAYVDNSGSGDLFQRVMRFVIEAKSSSPQQVISRILFYLADALGDSLDKPSKRNLERAVGDFVNEAHVQRGGRMRFRQPLCNSVTGVVLSYQERDDVYLPNAAMSRIRSGMHVHIPLRPFDATVQLLPPPAKNTSLALCDYAPHNENDDDSLILNDADILELRHEIDEQDMMGRMMASQRSGEYCIPCTPQSFPPTPNSRSALLGNYSEFTENVLWRARDELRGEQEENERIRMAIFNPKDCHRKVLLSCGGHCATVENKANAPTQTIYRSVRAALSFQVGRFTYFEIVAEWTGDPGSIYGPDLLNLCIGVSTSEMPLRNTVSGCSPKTCGLDSSGILLCSGRRTQTTGFSYGDVLGVCVRTLLNTMEIGFFINGKSVSYRPCQLGMSEDENAFLNSMVIKSEFPIGSYYPTVSIKSNHVKAFAHYSAADMHETNPESPFWNDIASYVDDHHAFALDGTRLF